MTVPDPEPSPESEDGEVDPFAELGVQAERRARNKLREGKLTGSEQHPQEQVQDQNCNHSLTTS